jgi:hypothetical protein
VHTHSPNPLTRVTHAFTLLLQVSIYFASGEDEKGRIDLKALLVVHVIFWLFCPLVVWLTIHEGGAHLGALDGAILALSSLSGGLIAFLLGPVLYAGAMIVLIFCATTLSLQGYGRVW